MTESLENVDTQFKYFLEIVQDSAEGNDWADVEHAYQHKPKLLSLHQKLMTEDKSYKDVFNAYSQAIQSPEAAKINDKLGQAIALDEKGQARKAFFTASGALLRHAPTVFEMWSCENQIERAFKNNYKP